MSDSKLRTLVRSAALRPGDAEARAALLRERLRSGELSEERLRLAAWLGDSAALLVLGKGAPEPLPARVKLRERIWSARASRGARSFAVLAEHDASVFVRAALRVVGAARTPLEAEAQQAVTLTTERARAWLECPCSAHATAARDASGEAFLFADHCAYAADYATVYVAGLAAQAGIQPDQARAIRLGQHALQAVAPGRLRSALRASLLPLALGTGASQ